MPPRWCRFAAPETRYSTASSPALSTPGRTLLVHAGDARRRAEVAREGLRAAGTGGAEAEAAVHGPVGLARLADGDRERAVAVGALGTHVADLDGRLAL